MGGGVGCGDELLEQVQHDFGEGPCLAAFAEDRVVAVEDLGSERVWDRLAAVVGQLHVRGVLSVPVRLADLPVGTLDVYASQPRPGRQPRSRRWGRWRW